MTVTETDYIYTKVGDLALNALVYRPDVEAGARIPLIVDIHGGAWTFGHRKSGRYYDRQLAAAGICVVAIDFRQGPDWQHPASVMDILTAVDWAANTDLGIEPASVGLVGSSSGGHLALYAALDSDGFDHVAAAAIDHVIALWPVSNPLARYQYVTARHHEDPSTFVQFAPDKLKFGHDAYFTDLQQMHDAAIQNILLQGRFGHLPPVFIVQPELDQNVPIMMSQTLAGAWELAGGNVSYKCYPGVAHGFAHADGTQTEACITDMIDWIHGHSGPLQRG